MSEETCAPRELRSAGLLVGLEAALALLAAGVLAVLTVLDTPLSYGLAIAGVALGVAAAAALAKVARGVARAQTWARAPATVAQLLLLPVGWTVAATNGRPLFGGPLLVLAVAVLVLTFSPAGRAAFPER